MADETSESTTLTRDEQGTAFRNAVESAGITYQFDGVGLRNQQDYWNNLARKYMGTDWDGQNADIELFKQDIALAPGGSVTQQYIASEDIIISTSKEDPFIYTGAHEFGCDFVDEYTGTEKFNRLLVFFVPYLDFRYNEDIVSGAGILTDFEHTMYLRRYYESGTEGTQSVTIYRKQSSSSKDDYVYYKKYDVTYEYYFMADKSYVTIHPVVIVDYSSKDIRYETEYTNHQLRYDCRQTHIGDLGFTAVSVTLSIPSGGGGGGIEPTSTLTFTATAGLSGRHCDPLHGSAINHPAPRTEIPAYGCGGFGGHGGAGGAGASTVVIRKFSTDKADDVEQIAIAKRHGYGSGGGAGGKGGDGCILIFW